MHEQQMKLTIFAATGGIGRQLLKQAVAQGHDVTAVVRNPTKLTEEALAVTADLAAPDPAALESAVHGADAVLSGLGPRSKLRRRNRVAGDPGRRGSACSASPRRSAESSESPGSTTDPHLTTSGGQAR
jgi:NAD(P)-dependent dehydrogenase (short-subunit alcohol dehydrogenase family)